ncbi:initiator tRNA phosphoribosyl transferase-domain-containing protein [Microdochium trichocladiopsis]|uniref:Initiator tRNA phosphoribosyl transferase-domain-containing protein n=1 Tax=Microdochium trichocladiopsis TaxID=1682393 RepID=A0A9P8YB93_9PEZI|nr:initiator tRNA phosphoribosyl transferase-domain-containing protein [Microdochium trichocladiopsis]KAH7033164.1 initiator tRNA phosphoribosyl transferase-domain-containing protein [Microdochium trichocladiopsis]
MALSHSSDEGSEMCLRPADPGHRWGPGQGGGDPVAAPVASATAPAGVTDDDSDDGRIQWDEDDEDSDGVEDGPAEQSSGTRSVAQRSSNQPRQARGEARENNSSNNKNRKKKTPKHQQQQQQPSAVSDLIFSSAQSAGHQFNHILSALKKSNLSMHNRLRSVQADAAFVQRVQKAYFYDPPAEAAPRDPPASSVLEPQVMPPRTRAKARHHPRPLIANERCGSWYIPPSLKQGSAYFKSTDGHFGIWGFSTRRLNLQLLKLIGENDGCIIVDSTRRGKRMPDALSKTVPMWCCVVNCVLLPEGMPAREEGGGGRRGERKDVEDERAGGGGGGGCPHKLYTPPNAVSESEHAQMEARVPEHVEAFKRLGLDLEPYRKMLKKPLRPMWVTQESHLDVADEEEQEEDCDTDGENKSYGDDENGREQTQEGRTSIKGVTVFEDFHPVICCTSSRRVVGGEMSEGGYIQGAGDDTENWAFGLTPPIFWANADLLLSTPEADLPGLVRQLVDQAKATPTPQPGQSSSSQPSSPPSSSPQAATSASLLSKHQQVAPGIFVARTADIDASMISSSPPLSQDTPTRQEVCTIIINQSTATDPSTWPKSSTHMDVGVGGKQSKIASRNLRAALPQIAEFVGAHLEQALLGMESPGLPQPPPTQGDGTMSPVEAAAAAASTDNNNNNHNNSSSSNGPNILIACDSGRDLSIGVALALVCQHCCTTSTSGGGGTGTLTFRPRKDAPDGVNKTLIKSRLGHIMALFPDANPSRATLQSVNSYLMG